MTNSSPTCLLAIETSTVACSVALAYQGNIYAEHQIIPKQHNKLILSLIDELLHQAELTTQHINHIAFDHGPGSFTGIRLATAITQGVALATNAKVLGLSSLQILAQTAYQNYHAEKVAVAIDARKNEVYWGLYQIDPETRLMQSLVPDQLLSPDSVHLPEEAIDWLGVGNGWEAYSLPHLQSASRLTLAEETLYPNTTALVTLAQAQQHLFQPLSETVPLPVYLREKVTY